MKKIAIILSLLFLTNSAFAGSCPMMAKNIDSKIEEAQTLRDAGMKAHEDGNHAESEKLLKKTNSYEFAFTIENKLNVINTPKLEIGRYMVHSKDNA